MAVTPCRTLDDERAARTSGPGRQREPHGAARGVRLVKRREELDGAPAVLGGDRRLTSLERRPEEVADLERVKVGHRVAGTEERGVLLPPLRKHRPLAGDRPDVVERRAAATGEAGYEH